MSQGKGGKVRRFVTLSVAALTVVFVLSYAVPAVGGPGAFSSASPAKLAKRALKTAKKADRRSKQALTRFNGVVGTNIRTVTSAPFTVVPGGVGSGFVECPPGTVVISGGFLLTGPEASVFFDRRSANGWTVGVDNVAAADPATGSPTAQFTIDAQCAAIGSAVASSRSASADRRRDRRLVEQRRAAHRREP
jgi:hypothetical protein